MSIFSAITITFLSVLVMALTATLYVVSPKKDPDFNDSEEEGEMAEFNENFLGDKVTEFSYTEEYKRARESEKSKIDSRLQQRQELIDEFKKAELDEMTQLRLKITTLENDLNMDMLAFMHLDKYFPFDETFALYQKHKDDDVVMDNYIMGLKDHEKDLEDMGK